MRFSPAQKRLVLSMFERLGRRQRPARAPYNPSTCGAAHETSGISSIAGLTRDQFVQAVAKAHRDADEANALSRGLAMWAVRLGPYLERDPGLTLEQALVAYTRARQSPQRDGPAVPYH